MSDSLPALKDMANKLRIHSIESTNVTNSGHPTSCCSIADILSVLFFDTMRYHVTDPRNPNNDRFILSKGHAAPILYACWAEAGLFPVAELLTLRLLNSDLEGHPTPRLSFVDVATGSLGQGLSVGVGMAINAKMEKSDYRTYVLMGDGETAEGSVWEAASLASHYKLDNLVAIVDVNRLGQSEATMFGHDMETYRKRFDAFGWNAVVIDGHDVAAVKKAFDDAAAFKGKPTALLAHTLKGKGIPGVEDQLAWHGKALGDKAPAAIAHIKSQMTGANGLKPKTPTSDALKIPGPPGIKIETPAYKKGQEVATRVAYGAALVKLGKANPNVVGLDGDTKNSTYAEKFKIAFPDRFVECFIAEQNLVGVAVGLGTRHKIPFVSTFACFLSRAYDQVRMAAISLGNVKLVGSHAGVSIGEDGASQMALEDLAIFRSIPDCVVFYPSDAVSAERACEAAANYHGMVFIRTSRPVTPVLYDNDEPFAIGKAKVVRQSDNDVVTIVAAGITMAESVKAADMLAAKGIHVRSGDPFTSKPLDKDTIAAAAKATGGKIITVEDHYSEGGIGDAVAGELSEVPGIRVFKICVREIPHSGEPMELLHRFGISAEHIAAKIEEVAKL
ncbi:MAG: transketolase [Planctomycetia bacterium]